MRKGKFYITTAIAYTSRKPHIGNSYEIVMTDAIARYKRLQGYDVFFQTGTDEHGQKIEEIAAAEGITPKQHVDRVAGEIKDICDLLNTTYDKFIRTTDPDHEKVIQKIFKKLYDQGDIYKGHYEGMYCTPCESFWTESQLVDGKCPDCGREVKPAREEAYFLKLFGGDNCGNYRTAVFCGKSIYKLTDCFGCECTALFNRCKRVCRFGNSAHKCGIAHIFIIFCNIWWIHY